MILGTLQPDRSAAEIRAELTKAIATESAGRPPDRTVIWTDDGVGLCRTPLGLTTMEGNSQPLMRQDGSFTMIWQGKIYNADALNKATGPALSRKALHSGEILLDRYHAHGRRFLEEVNGKFAFALWDGTKRELLLGRDRLGIETVYYRRQGQRLWFCSALRGLWSTDWCDAALNHQAILQYLLFCYNPGLETFLRGVYKVPAGHMLVADRDRIQVHPYWRLSFAEQTVKSEETYCREIVDLIEDAVRIRSEPHHRPGVFLSGGTDSSALVSLTSRLYDRPLRTFSFRCRGKAYDESSYARLVADQCHTEHTEVPYDAHQVGQITAAVPLMDEPFCDIGIEIGTYLLGQAAQGQISYVFSGEGGDEAFGGHPVYTADKVAALVDRIPRVLLTPLLRGLGRLPDSDQKKNLQVKAKRFAYSLAFPRELLSHRWRIYYTSEELGQLCTPDFLDHCDLEGMYRGILQYNRLADGRDALSRSLYSDYWTLVDFYLRRLGLLRAFSVESRVPLLDYRLVEYAATIPAPLKVRRFSETKYIYRKALDGVVPHEILYQRPKLGHSVPLKNWLREDEDLRQVLLDHLSDDTFRSRGLFRQGAIDRMLREHDDKVHNHSHRLWALLVLELWLRAFRSS
jgi:asparagine synthase (glutamine-hydrolysing)